MRKLGLVAALVAVWALVNAEAADAQIYSGNEMLKSCSGENLNHCQGFVAGVADTIILMKQADMIENNVGGCLVSGITNSQLRDVLLKYLQDNPDKRHFPASALAINSFVKSFPCN